MITATLEHEQHRQGDVKVRERWGVWAQGSRPGGPGAGWRRPRSVPTSTRDGHASLADTAAKARDRMVMGLFRASQTPCSQFSEEKLRVPK